MLVGGGGEAIPSSPKIQNWIEIQDLLKKRLIIDDVFHWRIPQEKEEGGGKQAIIGLRYVGGVDVSYSKEDPSIACGSLAVLDLLTLQVVYCDSSIVSLPVPYVPGFLAFREVPIFLELLEKMKNNDNLFYPQLLMVDGNGLLHPRGFGLACHLGILANLPTIGIGKNLHHVDGLSQSKVRQLLQAEENSGKDFITLQGCSGCIWGVAMRSTEDSFKPIYISVGHRISLDTAIRVVKMACKYRVPEPIRQADIRSREYLRMHKKAVLEQCNCSDHV